MVMHYFGNGNVLLAMVTRYEYFTRYIILLPFLLLVTNYSFPKSNLSYITTPQKVVHYSYYLRAVKVIIIT